MGQTSLRAYDIEPEIESAPVNSRSELNLCPKPLVLSRGFQSQSLLGSLFSNLREALFPRRLPPLELTSRPVAVADPMKVKRSSTSRVVSAILHALAIAFILWGTMQLNKHRVLPITNQTAHETPIYMPPVAPPAPTITKGGGGAPHVVRHKTIHLPHFQKLNLRSHQVIHSQPRHIQHPTPPSVELASNASDNSLPQFGNPNSPRVALKAQDSGTGSGVGQGLGGGIGAGSGGGAGGGVMSVGGGVSAPRLIHSVQPNFTSQARQARLQGVVALQLIVDSNGHPEDIHIVHHLGMGLDEKAIEAVRQYRFKPAMFHGHPVPVHLVIDVHFRLY